MLSTLLLACTSTDVTASDTGWTPGWVGTEDTPGDSGAGSTEPTDTQASYVGAPPAQALGLPEFSVSNQYGLMRSADFLEGSPVALWFFTTGWSDC